MFMLLYSLAATSPRRRFFILISFADVDVWLANLAGIDFMSGNYLSTATKGLPLFIKSLTRTSARAVVMRGIRARTAFF